MAAVLCLLLAGCGERPDSDPGPPLDDRGEFPIDIEAPPPDEDVYEDPEEELEPPGLEPFTIRGRIVDPTGAPIAGVAVWVEGADLREPVNNLDVYRQARDASLVTTDADGNYSMRLEGGFLSLYANHGGWLPFRTAPPEILEGTTYVNMTLKREPTSVIAHRGASFYAPENTRSAIEKAALLGANVVEIDVRITADGRVVAFHDHTLERTTDGEGRVRDWTLAELQALDAGAWFDGSFRGERILSVEEVFDAADAHGVALLLDAKAEPDDRERTWAAVLGAMAARGSPQVTFAAFRQVAMERCVPTGLPCAHLMDTTAAEDPVRRAGRLGVDRLLLDLELYTSDVASRAHERGISVSVWILNDEDLWEATLPLRPAGIVTDLPGRLLEYLNGHES